VDIGNLIGRIWKDLEWGFFYAQYCVGRNIGHPLCSDFRLWAGGIAALVGALVVLLTLRRLWFRFRVRRHERALAKVADAKAMDEVRWSGFASSDAKAAARDAKR
jgi:prolipoprotein diacylglyceryltransferase